MEDQRVKEAMLERIQNQFLDLLRPEFNGSVPDEIANNWHKMERDEFMQHLHQYGCAVSDWEETLEIYQEKYKKIVSGEA